MTSLMEPDKIIATLREGPGRIEVAMQGLSDDQLASHPEENEWSPNEILVHLRACADVWGDVRVIRMLAEDEPVIRAVNPKRWARETNYSEMRFRQSLAEFRSQRERLLSRLTFLTLEQWQRGAMFTGGGAPRHYTVHTEADALARHERAHLRQIEHRCQLLR